MPLVYSVWQCCSRLFSSPLRYNGHVRSHFRWAGRACGLCRTRLHSARQRSLHTATGQCRRLRERRRETERLQREESVAEGGAIEEREEKMAASPSGEVEDGSVFVKEEKVPDAHEAGERAHCASSGSERSPKRRRSKSQSSNDPSLEIIDLGDCNEPATGPKLFASHASELFPGGQCPSCARSLPSNAGQALEHFYSRLGCLVYRSFRRGGPCEGCGQALASSLQGVARHLNTTPLCREALRTREGSGPAECQSCPAAFDSREKLALHRESRLGCTLSLRGLLRDRALQREERSFDEEANCDVCGFAGRTSVIQGHVLIRRCGLAKPVRAKASARGASRLDAALPSTEVRPRATAVQSRRPVNGPLKRPKAEPAEPRKEAPGEKLRGLLKRRPVEPRLTLLPEARKRVQFSVKEELCEGCLVLLPQEKVSLHGDLPQLCAKERRRRLAAEAWDGARRAFRCPACGTVCLLRDAYLRHTTHCDLAMD